GFSRDWSSDVCSSDLPPRHGARDALRLVLGEDQRLVAGALVVELAGAAAHGAEPGGLLLQLPLLFQLGVVLALLRRLRHGLELRDRKSTRLNSSHVKI